MLSPRITDTTSGPCPQAIHTTYQSEEYANVIVRERRKSGVVCRAIVCRTCGNWRVERIA